MRRLALLDDTVAETTARILVARQEWPCTRGCDHCCRSLASPMRVSRPEWERMAEHLASLDKPARASFAARLDEPRVCALLDLESGACSAYHARPIACRAYGFYLGRDGGRWCELIEREPSLTDDVLLGNHDALERSLETLGETRTIAEWWRGGGSGE